jgi:sodium transport system permease protein
MFSQNLLIGEFVRGETVSMVWLALSMGSTLAIGFAFTALAATLFSRPRVVFTS